MTKLFRLGQYTRHDRHVWYSPCQVAITDEQVIARLEAEYQASQRQTKGPRPPLISGGEWHSAPRIERRKGQYKTNREPRGNGRVE